jgi:hypothetical protein
MGEWIWSGPRRGTRFPGAAIAEEVLAGTIRALRDRPRVRPARSASELDRFAESYELVSGYRVDRAYLDRAQVLVAVRAGRVVGGFALNVEPPFRTMARLPEAEQRRLAPAFPTDDTVELTCVWLAPEARGHVSSATLWGKLVWHASRRRRTRVVFGTEVDRLRRLYELTGPELLYEGDVRVDGQSRHGWVYAIAAGRWPVVLLRVVSWRRAKWPRP